jgi:integrase
LAKHVAAQRRRAAGRLQALLATPPGEIFTIEGEVLRRVALSQRTDSVWAQPLAPDAKRRNLVFEEHQAFWAWAVVEVLRRTGIRIEELTELSHHSITQYRLPTTGEVVPLLQIAPSKTDEERLLLVGPELADVLSAIVTRIRQADGRIPSIPAYDTTERVWNPPMPLLFQRPFAGEQRPISPQACRQLLTATIAESGLVGRDGQALTYLPHDFRRLFVTDAVMSGLPPHIAQVICGHRNINTTMGYKALYPEEAIEAHRAFIARRRAARPGEEYRTPSAEEWDGFLAHFEKRTLSVGTCARAFGTPCIHEHVFDVPCSALIPLNGTGWSRSATTSSPVSPRRSGKAGTARWRAYASASTGPSTRSMKSTPRQAGGPNSSYLACRCPVGRCWDQPARAKSRRRAENRNVVHGPRALWSVAGWAQRRRTSRSAELRTSPRAQPSSTSVSAAASWRSSHADASA